MSGGERYTRAGGFCRESDMGVPITDNIVAEQDADGHWYLRDTAQNLVSQEFFISVAIIHKCMKNGHVVTWVEKEMDVLPGEQGVERIN